MPQSRKPNWDKWRHFPDVNVIQVVALSLNIDPDYSDTSPTGYIREIAISAESREFADRVDIIRSNLGKHSDLKANIHGGNLLKSLVSLAMFHKFAKAVNWTLPAEFPAEGSAAHKSDVEKDRWLAQDAWSEAELRDLLCGLEPDSARESVEATNRAHEEIRRAVATKALNAHTINDATPGDRFYGHGRLFRPDDAIKWVSSKRGLFPKFPFTLEDLKSMETPVTEYMAGRLLLDFQQYLDREIARRRVHDGHAADALAHVLLHLQTLQERNPLAAAAMEAARKSKKLGERSEINMETHRLKKLVGVLALAVADKGARFKRGAVPNAKQISELVGDILNSSEEFHARGLGSSNVRAAISEGLKLLSK